MNRLFKNPNRLIRNAIFWIFYTSMEIAMIGFNGIGSISLWLIIKIIGYGIPAYLHNDYILPRFFHTKRFTRYALSFISWIIITLLWATCWEHLAYLVSPNPHFDDTAWSQPLEMVKKIPEIFFILIGFALSNETIRGIRLRQEVATMKTEMLQSELDNLKSQINPHFLFNGLNTIYGLSKVNPLKSTEAILQLSDILRYVIYECNEQYVSLEQELKFVKEVVEFAKLRSGDLINTHVRIEGETEELKIPPMILIPLIENCFKHTNTAGHTKPWIDINIQVEKGVLSATFRNSFLENLNKTETRTESGVGLNNVRRRLSILNKNSSSLVINHANDTYNVELNLKLQR